MSSKLNEFFMSFRVLGIQEIKAYVAIDMMSLFLPGIFSCASGNIHEAAMTKVRVIHMVLEVRCDRRSNGPWFKRLRE